MAMLAILILPLSILGFSAIATVLPAGLAGPANQGPHGFSEILYTYTSCTGNKRQRVRRHLREHAVLQHDDRVRDADRPVPDDRADARDRRFLGSETDRTRVGRHIPDASAAVRRPAGRGHPDRRRPDFFPALALGRSSSTRDARRCLYEQPQSSPRRGTLMTTMEITPHMRKRMPVATITDPAILVPAIGQAFRKLDPRLMVKNPVMFAVEIVAALTTVLFIRDLVTGAGGYGFSFQINLWLWFTVLFANFAEAVAEGRGKAQAATLRKSQTETMAKLLADGGRISQVLGNSLKPATSCGRGGGHDPVRRRSHRGRRFGQRGGDHRRERAGDPRERRRPFGCDRRYRGHLRLDQGAHHRGPGFDLPRPDDCACRGRRAAEDAERDRSQHPAGRHDADLRLRRRDDPRATSPMLAGASRCWCSWRCS